VEYKGIMSDTLLTVKEAAARLALGRTTLYELIARHELKTIKIGRARRVPESALQQWIAQQVHEQDGEAEPTIESPSARSQAP
jgi:excisionase family DNA binding protein